MLLVSLFVNCHINLAMYDSRTKESIKKVSESEVSVGINRPTDLYPL